MKKLNVLVVLLALCGNAWAQECVEGAVNCAEIADDPVCVVQTQLGLSKTGQCDRATAGALIGDGFSRYYQFGGVFPTDAEQNAFAICSRTGPVRKDGKCGWYRFEQAGEVTASATAGDPLTLLVTQKKDLRTGREKAEDAVVKKVQAEDNFLARIYDAFGVRLRPYDFGLVGGTAGVTNAGWFTGGTALLHLGIGSNRSGVEIGAVGGYGGYERVTEASGRKAVVFHTQVGPVVQGVLMPWKRVGFVVGAEWDHLIPSDDRPATDLVVARNGVRGYFNRWLALEVISLAGMIRDVDANWSGAGGGQLNVLLHF
ncbi:hypothetical protein A3B21_04675 [Candidatus Uhrbacteria bacterium RIFCSPLOWO2_01_FULL_47_24]|uniref:Uncharacterized protein n=1 Tax=Candidatus Uhrbacteria bacterium RIFCSPLOWO2_01_FULL_47_24 TaxID=1802401 RepID=A0A1F7UTT1_9BACT|nr:MAG: hypothetical protein A3B21_04675 [Candidatus Uhrbacteria bacterium RIFCSPLOWO2_01_FULL_47_24]OGL85034.1 MAG: hypothetical protein A3J03_03645 [Candidatus Uhrbacteria bacterium RIFCSPLOWO2_02_FULL_46_25]OGL91734.1 MAG: hypothetical protein A3H11_01170 [Candidatus Uhrbacteria bacterium RIFCSPLOWO2_12_FULL_47_10]